MFSHSIPLPELRHLFAKLSKIWKNKIMFMSSVTDIVAIEEHQQIIGLGPQALTFIFEDLRDNGGWWFHALRSITRENPVPEDHRGKVNLMTEDWLKWGYLEGYVSLGMANQNYAYLVGIVEKEQARLEKKALEQEGEL